MLTVSSFNWDRGIWSDPSSGAADVSLCIAGDWAPIRAFQPIIENTPEKIYGDLLPMIRSADLSIVNLEAPLSDRGSPVHKSGAVFKGERNHVQGLCVVPFDVVTLANNHMFDYGLDAFQESLDSLDENHIKHTGAGMSEQDAQKPLKIDINGLKIGIVNFSEGEDLTAAHNGPGVMGWDLATVIQTVKALKAEMDIVLVISHCGIEYIPFPPPYVANAFIQIADAGADLVIGHHPHVPQGISFHNHIPICHSLGNFVFYQETDLKFRKLGYMVKAGLKKNAVVSLELIPYQIDSQGLSRLKDQYALSFFQKFKQISLPLDSSETLQDAWHGFLDYYGKKGFFNEISMITEKMAQDPQKGAAMFRNRLTTLQHYHHWKDFMTRMVKGDLDSSPAWAKALIREWLTAKIDPA
ncbi:CapA family protein [Desulfobacula sp.]|uniref:CapA family protein n=1 Tax=Desulfobacula sp. TaxID=2593537 RepID=UPI002614ED87|nr:CapA family protein [Desulfobacula sp.]